MAEANSSNLKRGHVTSCGCNRTEDLTGQRFGRLTVLYQVKRKAQPDGQMPTRWKCKCDCGYYTVVTTGNLKSGHTTSCGCLKSSKNESKIEGLLNKWKVPHSREYMFPDLVSDKGNPLRFDFAFLNAEGSLVALLEYQGEQHFFEVDKFKDFGRQQREVTDKQKKAYCKQNSIPLYEITYKDQVSEMLRSIVHTLYGNLVPSLAETARKV